MRLFESQRIAKKKKSMIVKWKKKKEAIQFSPIGGAKEGAAQAENQQKSQSLLGKA